MIRLKQLSIPDLHRDDSSRYPIWGIVAIVALIFMSPFVRSLTSYLAFALCVYRVVRYDSRVFIADYCVLIPLSIIFRTSWGMALQVYLCLFAVIWYLIRGGVKANATFVLLVVLLNYLVARMQLEVTLFLLCVGPLSLMCVILPKQDSESAERAIKAYCCSLIAASVYALLLRHAPQIRAICGPEVPPFRGSPIRRFQGLLRDPNYYMHQLAIGLALLVKLKESRKINSAIFWTMGACLVFFGILTFSKTFFIVFILLGIIYVIWQFRNRKYLYGGFMSVVGAVAIALVLLFADVSPFSVVLTRLTNVSSLSELTTGRTDVFAAYMSEIMENVGTFLFGMGMGAGGLAKDPHNLYLEIAYYIGFVGLGLVIAYFGTLVRYFVKRSRRTENQNLLAKYAVLLMVLVLHLTLHGMFTLVTYAGFMLAFLSILLTKKKEAK